MARAHIAFASQALAHVPNLVLSGSKPRREIARDRTVLNLISASLRTFDQASRYLPNQIFIGARNPVSLTDPMRPWWSALSDEGQWEGKHGALLCEAQFLAALSAVDSTGVLRISPDRMANHIGTAQTLLAREPAERAGDLLDPEPIPAAEGTLGCAGWGYVGDDALSPGVVLENMVAKASGALALAQLLQRNNVDPQQLDYVISCSEEAIGDRYQRGGGNLGKAIAESVGASRASGFDVKNFCAAPIPALVVAASLVESGVAETVAVVAGGSLAKLGMKFQGHLKAGMPILEDCLGGVAALVSAADEGPAIRYDGIGKHSVDAGSANPAIFSQLVLEPLERLGLGVMDVDLIGTELHNPELTEPQGSGDVPMRNYRMVAAVATRGRQIEQSQIPEFLATRCVSGFAPTQGHIASAICLLPHILAEMRSGAIRRAQLVAKGSLFLGRMTAMSDGMSALIEA